MRAPSNRQLVAAGLAVAAVASAFAPTRPAHSDAVGAARTVIEQPRPRCPIPPAFRPEFEQAAGRSGLPLSLLVAVASVESQFTPGAVPSAGARGLMQVLPSTASILGLDAATPRENILAGALYLSGLFDRFGSADLAVAAYNAGPTAVEHSGGVPAGIGAYVQAVTGRWFELGGCV